MSFCWFTSFIGYPDFFGSSGNAADLARTFLELGRAAKLGLSYQQAKQLFPEIDPHQVETKKAAFQEFGLLYVVPRSNVISLTPLGEQVLALNTAASRTKSTRMSIIVALVRGLSRYQFANPLPVGGASEKYRARASSTDVRPYLACYWLMHRLDGLLTASELRGAVFALQFMRDLLATERRIAQARDSQQMLVPHSGMPEKRGTAENLKIYFMAHLGLAGHVVSDLPRDTVYASGDQVFRLTNIGREVTRTVLDDQWPSWRGKTVRAPVAASYATVESYFTAGVGEACPTRLLASEPPPTEYKVEETVGAEVGTDALESLKELPEREYKEGLARLVKHVRIERLRSPALVKEAKKAFRARHRRLFCEACGFDFERRYGQRGRDYIEAHHRIPISKLDRVGPTTVSRKDLALVCANCHRMLHRSPWISVEALQKLLSGN